MSFVLEQLLLQLLQEGRLDSDDELLMQINRGVAARTNRIDSDGRRTKASDLLDDARDELKFSGDRMLLYLRTNRGISCCYHCVTGVSLTCLDATREHIGPESPPLSSIHTNSESSFG
jgi:hypothetical protein